MLQIVIPGVEREEWDEQKDEFVYHTLTKPQVLHLEHSLIALSKWESKWCRSFLSKEEKTKEEIVDYIRFMTLDKSIESSVYDRLSEGNLKDVMNYIEAPMTATTFPKSNDRSGRKRRITSELIYYWMIACGIPFECERWHLNRLLTLIRVCNTENAPSKKINAREAAMRNAQLKEYYFRVRATNSAGNSGWSMHASVVLGKEPSAPTTWSSTTTAMVGESLNLYWVHNSQDGSYEKMAELELTVNGSTETKTFYNNTSEDDQDKARSYSVNTGQYTEGTTIKWRVRTSGITGAYSEWSVLREVNVYARPTVALIVTNQNGAVISSLSSFPFYLKASPGPASQKPISYHVEITADDGYETVDQVGNVIRISAGESIYSKYFNSSSILIVEFSAGNVDFENGMTYTATVTVSMNSGLSCSASKTFTVDWEETISEPNAEIGYDSERYTCQIRPYCEDMDGNLINGILLSVYRREYNGEFIEIASGLPNSASHYVIDPHPALDYARYRIIATETATGAVSYYDVPGYPINESGVIIQWSEAWSAFDVSDANEADVVDTPPWSGSLIRIPYNIDVSDKADPDVTLVKYAGRKRQVSYYGTQLGESSTWRVEIPADDNETLYALRRLMIWTGDVYVREPSGSGYWANVKVSFSRTHCALTIPVTFDITRVEGGM